MTGKPKKSKSEYSLLSLGNLLLLNFTSDLRLLCYALGSWRACSLSERGGHGDGGWGRGGRESECVAIVVSRARGGERDNGRGVGL